MRVFVYRKQGSSGARDLAEAIDGIRYRALTLPIEQKVRVGDFIIAWGEAVGAVPPGAKVLNGAPIQSKFEDALKLKAAGVPTIEVSRTQPATTAQEAPPDPALAIWQRVTQLADDFVNIDLGDAKQAPRTPPATQGVSDLLTHVTHLLAALRTPAPQARPDTTIWLPRKNHHVGGNDLLRTPERPDYFSKKEHLTQEIRVHSFLGKSIRAGVKVPRDGYGAVGAATNPAHPWVRSWDGGWRIKYDGVTSKQAHRDLAHRAVKALGLDFGAVDIGVKADGTLIVLEVNRAPGLEGGTVDAYARAVQRWIDGTAAPEEI